MESSQFISYKEKNFQKLLDSIVEDVEKNMSRFVSWFATKNGKIFTRTCVGITGFSIFGAQVAFHGPLQEKFKSLCQVYREGEEKPLSPKLKELTSTVLKDSTLSHHDKSKVRFFNVIGNDLFHIGGTNSPWGAMVGLPFYFEDSKDINFGQLRLSGHETIDWIVDGEDLVTALTLTDKAKKFGAMRELYACDIWHILDNAAISTTCFLIPAEISRRVNESRKAFERATLRGRVLSYVFFFFVGFVMYRCLRDPLRHFSAKKYDEMAASAGPEYLEGGVEFYEKSLLKNKALRELLGKRGESMFNKDGSENYWLFAPKLPTRKRLEFLQEMEKELTSGNLISM